MKVAVRNMLRITSNEMNEIVTRRCIPIRHWPSARDKSAMGYMKEKVIKHPDPPSMKTIPVTHAQSRRRRLKGARRAWVLSTKKRYLGVSVLVPWSLQKQLKFSSERSIAYMTTLLAK